MDTNMLHPPAPASFSHTRRDFLKRTGGGIMVFFTVRGAWAADRPGGKPGDRPDFNAYLRIGADGKVTGYSGKIEMGQGVKTSLAQMLAEELDVPMESVQIVMGDTDLCPWDAGTWGSMTTRFFGPALRLAAAESRAILLELAAEQLNTEAGTLTVRAGVISDPTGKRVTFGELAQGRVIERYLETEPTPKDFADFKVSGKSYKRVDAYEKVTGHANYAGDIRLPGMVYAKILRPPAHGAKLKSVDTAAVSEIAGAEVIRDGELIAAAHALPDVAEQALEKIKAEWEPSDSKVNDTTIYDYLLEFAPEGKTVEEAGAVQQGESDAEAILENAYLDGYVAHAPMETHTALAVYEGEKLSVWAATQTPFGYRKNLSQALGLPEENIHVIAPYVGGGFGGKIVCDQVIEAARLARAAQKPVQVAWSREEEFFLDTFRPAAVVKIKSGIDRSGTMTLWDCSIFGAGKRGSEMYYAFPNFRTVERGGRNAARNDGGGKLHPLGVGAWRAPDNNTNTWARESQIDMMAEKAGMDPVDFRLKNLKDERLIRTIKAAADKFGWTPAKPPSGRGYGIATGLDVGTFVALMAEVSVDKATGEVEVKRVVCAQDMGQVINPEGAILQAEGCVAMGLGYALMEHVRFDSGRVLDTGFLTYKLPKFSQIPKTEVVLVESNDLSPQGGGEPAIICMGGVIANAIFDATGARIYHLPMTPERIKAALAGV